MDDLQLPPLAICRIQKLKDWSNIKASHAHNARTISVLNANSLLSINNTTIIDTPSFEHKTLKDIFDYRLAGKKIRCTAVLLVEFLLTASPQYFRPENPSEGGYFQLDKMVNFSKACQTWLQTKYQDNLIRAFLHLDEQTPHIHAYFIPIDEKGNLNCRAFFGGREKLSLLQDDFARALAHLGIQRGIKGSRAKHQDISKYYARVNSQSKSLDLQNLPHTLYGETADNYKQRIQRFLSPEIETINAQITDRKSLIDENLALKLTLRQHELTRNQLEQKVEHLTQENFNFQDEIQNYRDLPLSDVAWHLGLLEDFYGSNRWKGHGHIIQINQNLFYDFAPEFSRGGKGAINLVIHVAQCHSDQAIAWLHSRFGQQDMSRAITAQLRETAIDDALNIVSSQKIDPFYPPFSVETNWYSVKNYLVKTRCLPKNWVEGLHQAGFIYSDSRCNAVFTMRALTNSNQINGAFLRGTIGRENNAFKAYAPGTVRHKGHFYFRQGDNDGEPSKAILCKSPIDAMSLAIYQQPVTENTLYIVVDCLRSVPFPYLDNFQSLVCAFENSTSGQRLYQDIKRRIPKAQKLTPKIGDWNDALREVTNKPKTTRKRKKE
jgi:hypothetical protein